MMKSANNPELIFETAVNWFFGHNPRNPYWILAALHLRHEHRLHVVENYCGDKSCIIADVLDKQSAKIVVSEDEYISKWETGILQNISIIGDISEDSRLQNILKTFQANMLQPGNGKNILNLRQWEPNFLLVTARLLLDIDDDWFDSNFVTLFDTCISRVFAKQNGEMYIQPKEISLLGAKLLGEIQGQVFNPFAGTGSYAINIRGNFEYLGEEKDNLTAAIGNLRLIANGINGIIKVTNSIALQDITNTHTIATPPFGVRIFDHIPDPHPTHTYELLLLSKLINNKCRSVVVCSAGACFVKQGRQIRRKLVNNDCIDMVILLPENTFSSTGSTVIFVIDKNHNHKGSIRFVDASKCYTGAKPKINVDEVIRLTQESSNKSILVPIKIIGNENYLLTPALYMPVQKPNREGDLVSIREICYIELHPEFSENRGLVSKLSNVNKAKVFTPEDFEYKELSRPMLKITKPCVLVGHHRDHKVVCVDPMGKKLYVSNAYSMLVIKESALKRNITPQYLALQFQEEYVQSQILGLNAVIGDVILRLQILMPSLEEQERYVSTYQNRLINDLGIKIANSKSREFEEFERNMQIRRHSLGNKLQSIMPAAQLIYSFISRQEKPFTKDAIVGKRSGKTLLEMAKKLYTNLERVEDLIDKFTEVEEFGEENVIDLDDFCATYANNAIKENYELIFSTCSVVTKVVANDKGEEGLESSNLLIRFSRKDLEYVFDNIITNAKKHGFTDKDRFDYNVHVKLGNFLDTEGEEKVYIRFYNNGNRLPVGMTPNKVFDWGEGNGSGLGGWHLKRIVEHFGGTISFQEIENSADGYTVAYEIIVPLVNAEE